jgi:hypothetical protein
VKFFVNPKESIEQWYQAEVNGFVRLKKNPDHPHPVFDTTFASECDRCLSEVSRSSDLAQINDTVAEMMAGTKISYTLPKELSNVSPKDVRVLRDAILNYLKKKRQSHSVMKESDLREPCDASDIGINSVMSRLGCTSRCPWCGALCWGQRGHEKHTDETKMHHASHQPQGLFGTRSLNDKTLLARPCHDTSDDTSMHFGAYYATGLPWGETKLLPPEFSTWKYERHVIAKFDKMMRWFFSELHVDIAAHFKCLPATTKQLERYGCVNLPIDAIMNEVKLSLGQ